MKSRATSVVSAVAWVVASAFGLAACWDAASLDVQSTDPALTPDGGETPDTAPACDPGRVACGNTCVDTSTDIANCGACGTACLIPPAPACEGASVAVYGAPTCVAGGCVFAKMLIDCAAQNRACVAAQCGPCAPGFQDKDNSGSCTPDCATSGLSCSGHGACSDTTGTAKCVCDPGYSGTLCATNINDCLGNPCLNGGACTDIVGGYTCACLPGYSGANCQTNINDCSPNPCVNGGTCVDGVNSFTCNCQPGYNGPTCANDINDCAASPCLNGGVCVDGVNTYSCNCAVGFTGANCQTNINDCSPNPCMNGGACVDGVNSYTCNCAVGYTGANCQTNIDDCSPNPCLNGGTCVDGVNTYSCNCINGFSGMSCQTPPATPQPTFLWLDATNAASITKDGANNVSQWADLSGLARHASVGGNTAPVWTAGVTPNGQPAILFSGNTVRLQTAPALTSSEMTIFVVFNMVSPFTWGSIINQAHDTYFSIRKSDCCGGNGNLNFHIQNDNAAPLLPITNNAWRLLTAMRSGTTSTMYYDQAAPQSFVGDTLTGGASVAITIGNAMAVAESMGGYIAEIRAYNTALDVGQRTAVETVLKAKFGL